MNSPCRVAREMAEMLLGDRIAAAQIREWIPDNDLRELLNLPPEPEPDPDSTE